MITKRKLLVIWFIGLISGFTVMISGNTLNFWLAKEQIDIETIGFFALISLPYAINFIWAPIFDVVRIPVLSKFFGHRTSWIISIQGLLSCAIYILSQLNPSNSLSIFAVTSVIVSLLSSTQDTVLGAMRTELIDSSKQGQVSGIYVFGYRLGMLISSSFAIYISSYMSWNLVYEIFSLMILAFSILLIILTKDLESSKTIPFLTSYSSLKHILNPIGSKKYLVLMLLFLILYRLPDNFIGVMINPFLVHIGYDEFEISTAGKFLGIMWAIVGGLIAGIFMKYFSILKSLLIFGILHGLGHSLFIIQEIYGKNIELLFFVTGFESITSGMTMAAYIGFISSQCKGQFKATQYSLLTSMMGLSRSILPAFSGYIVVTFSWKIFYLLTSLASIPSLFLILLLRQKLVKSSN